MHTRRPRWLIFVSEWNQQLCRGFIPRSDACVLRDESDHDVLGNFTAVGKYHSVVQFANDLTGCARITTEPLIGIAEFLPERSQRIFLSGKKKQRLNAT